MGLRDIWKSGDLPPDDDLARDWIEKVKEVVNLQEDLKVANERLDEAKEKNFDLARRVEYLQNQLKGAQTMPTGESELVHDNIEQAISIAQQLLIDDGEQSWQRRDECVEAAIVILQMARDLRQYGARKAT